MKLRIEVDGECDEEIIIRCREIDDRIKILQDIISNTVDKNASLCLSLNNTDYYINRNEILFFETCDNKTAAHTPDKMYYTDYRLYELEQILPKNFIRVSKSTVINLQKVSAISKNPVGASEVRFKNSPKKVYVSRMYYKIFKEKIDEERL